MRILVTGCAGFIGSYVADLLIKNGDQVYGVDDMSGGYWCNINPKCKFEKINLVNQKKTADLIKKIRPEIIYHLAADATEGRSQFTPINCTRRNYNTFLNTIVPAISCGLKKFVFVSSMSVYGKQKPPFMEDMKPDPEDIYAIAKTACENALKIFSEVFGFKYTIIRPHNVYGPRQNMADPYRNVIGIFINSLLNNKNYYIYGDGQQERSFTYIDDLAPYIVKVGILGKYNGEIFNVGPRKPISINFLSDRILDIFFEGKENVPEELKPVYVSDRPKEVKRAFSSGRKAAKMLNYKTRTSLEKGLRIMVNWAKSLGPKKFRYLKNLELVCGTTPKTWEEKLLK